MKPVIYALLILLAGCADIPRLTEADAATWGRFNDEYACKAAGGNKQADKYLSAKNRDTAAHNREMWLKEVKRRGLLSERDLTLISEGKIVTNMSRCAMYVSLGKPVKENKAVYLGVPRIQHIYPNKQYVYTQDNKVTSWQFFGR